MRNLKHQYKRYLIEFLVIVLGVSVSFMAEQWRQRINQRFEAEGLFEKAMSETKFFLTVDSFKVHFPARSFIQGTIAGRPIRPDSMHLVLTNGIETNMEIDEYFPSLFALTKRTDLSSDQIALIKTAASLVRIYRELDGDCKKLTEQMHALYVKHGITDDLIRLQNVQLEKSKIEGEVIFWNPLGYNVEYSGRYDLFAQDQEVIVILKMLYLKLTEQELLILELEKIQKQAEESGYI